MSMSKPNVDYFWRGRGNQVLKPDTTSRTFNSALLNHHLHHRVLKNISERGEYNRTMKVFSEFSYG